MTGVQTCAFRSRRHAPRRRFGQHFLVDAHYVTRILDAIEPRPGDNIVEIGPGLAALTAGLIARAGHLTAIEIDGDLAARLRGEFGAAQLTLHEADALAFDFATLGEKLRAVGNLPYTISSPLLFHLESFADRLADVHVMLQVTFRMTRLFAIPPGAFRPVPKVDSAFVRLVPLAGAKPMIADEALFGRIVAAAFGQRRKTLRNALASICKEAPMRALGIDPGARGETLAVFDYVRLANHLAGQR